MLHRKISPSKLGDDRRKRPIILLPKLHEGRWGPTTQPSRQALGTTAQRPLLPSPLPSNPMKLPPGANAETLTAAIKDPAEGELAAYQSTASVAGWASAASAPALSPSHYARPALSTLVCRNRRCCSRGVRRLNPTRGSGVPHETAVAKRRRPTCACGRSGRGFSRERTDRRYRRRS